MTKGAPRARIAVFGRYGYVVNVYATEVEGEPVARIEWREPTDLPKVYRRRTRTFRGGKRAREAEARRVGEIQARVLQVAVEARQRAQWPVGAHVVSTAEEVPTAALPMATMIASPPLDGITLEGLWRLYETANRPDWSPRTLQLSRARWRAFSPEFLPGRTYASTITEDTLDAWRAHLTTFERLKTGEAMAGNQIAHCVQLVKSVFAFGVKRGRLEVNAIATYKVRRGRASKAKKIPAFTPHDWARIIAQLDYRDRGQWRAWAAIALDGLLAPRSNALLNLQWPDIRGIRYPEDRTVTWRGETDKTGNDRLQPLPRDAVRVLRLCALWARREGYAGPFVFFGAQQRTRGGHYTYSALNRHLVGACTRAGVQRIRYQAMHGLRRLRGTRIIEEHGDLNAAADWLGDVDLGALKRSYIRTSPEYLRPIADATSLPATGRRRAGDPSKAAAATASEWQRSGNRPKKKRQTGHSRTLALLRNSTW